MMRNKQRRTVKPQAQIDKLRSHNLWNRRMSYQMEYTNLARLLLLLLPLLWIKLRAISFFIVPLLCWINENRINGRICKSIKTRNCMQSTLYFCIQNPEKCCTRRDFTHIHLIPEKLMISTIACETHKIGTYSTE